MSDCGDGGKLTLLEGGRGSMKDVLRAATAILHVAENTPRPLAVNLVAVAHGYLEAILEAEDDD